MSSTAAPPAGVGLASIDQDAPFQCSTSVTTGPKSPAPPTAVQFVALRHETATSSAFGCPAGSGGGGVMRHCEPSHRSASGWGPPVLANDPTARHALSLTQATSLSALCEDLAPKG